jgi:hypothetical protein
MSAMTVFYQPCPVCGRTLRINAKFFGREMSCTHCEGHFLAGNDQLPPKAPEVTVFTDPVADSLAAPLTFAQPQFGET